MPVRGVGITWRFGARPKPLLMPVRGVGITWRFGARPKPLLMPVRGVGITVWGPAQAAASVEMCESWRFGGLLGGLGQYFALVG